jgi:hypothetical protein
MKKTRSRKSRDTGPLNGAELFTSFLDTTRPELRGKWKLNRDYERKLAARRLRGRLGKHMEAPPPSAAVIYWSEATTPAASEQPIVDQPAGVQPTDQSADDQPTADQSADDQPTADQSAETETSHSATEKDSANGNEERPVSEDDSRMGKSFPLKPRGPSQAQKI